MNNPLAGTDPTGYVSCAASKIEVVCDKTISRWGGNGNADMTAFATSSGGASNQGNGAQSVQPSQGSAGGNTADIGSQNNKTSPVSNNSNNGSSTEPFKVSTTIDKENADDIDKKGFELTQRMADMTKKAIEQSGDESLIQEMNNAEFIYDPTHKVFEKDPDIAAFRFANEHSTQIYVGRKLVDVNDPNLTFPYHGTTIRGGDTGLLFVGLHEFGHVVGRQYANVWTPDRKERFANSFAKKHYPRRMSGTGVNRRDIKFAREVD